VKCERSQWTIRNAGVAVVISAVRAVAVEVAMAVERGQYVSGRRVAVADGAGRRDAVGVAGEAVGVAVGVAVVVTSLYVSHITEGWPSSA
jgi:hypothetical protein